MTKADTSLFKPDLVFFDLEAPNTDAFFGELGRRLSEKGYIKDTWLDAIRIREENYPTGLPTPGVGIAIPHTDPENLVKPYIAVIKPKTPIVFEAMAGMGDPVHAQLIVNLGVQHEGGQVQVLQNLMNIFMNSDAVADIMAQTTGEGMVSTITKYFE
ncbi:MAG: PTS sugar transporter subunit IIA [Atopobiaceae bacterium]|jgi:PTS system galactitol-specific IIA component|nr:PTS sugar transporter subunit IIA [Atopobiaceae bacterium]MCI2172922.1 PTS sugar transporter subunit IIA [Atopobiaceae bacterium]MCI2208327.1 PTS sugar transporter subunit IIA [Atopobiaceae bacterium]